MKALFLTVVGLVFLVAGTAGAESLSAARPHAAKRPTIDAKSASSANMRLSALYGTPASLRKAAIAQFAPVRTDPPVEPQGGFSFTAGREAPDAPFTGGLKLRF